MHASVHTNFIKKLKKIIKTIIMKILFIYKLNNKIYIIITYYSLFMVTAKPGLWTGPLPGLVMTIIPLIRVQC